MNIGGLLGMLGEETDRVCVVCGCTDSHACVDDHGNSCSWVDENVCSACDAKHGDACWMGPVDWITLRQRIQDRYEQVSSNPNSTAMSQAVAGAFEEVMQTMDEWGEE